MLSRIDPDESEVSEIENESIGTDGRPQAMAATDRDKRNLIR